jgi:cobalamin biosynthesis Co2+ chelatase CbiK
MAYKITEECLSCGACEAECPNQAISEGPEYYVIDAAKCTECVGAWVEPKCAQACAVSAPQPDPDCKESRKELVAKWRQLNPDKPPKGLILKADPAKPVIVIVADGGSSSVEGQKQMEDIDTLLLERFPDHDICWGMQAFYAIRGLQMRGQKYYFERGMPMWSAAEVLTHLAEEGITRVAMDLLMVHESSFSTNASNAPRHGIDVKVAMPFLSTPENRVAVIKALEPDFGDGTEVATVLIGHGVFKNFELNDVFIEMDTYLRENYKNVYCGTLHGPPGTERFVADVKKSGCKKVRFISLMISTSDHITLDVMGDEADSWKSLIGLPAEVVDNFSINPLVREFFVKSIEKLLSEFK